MDPFYFLDLNYKYNDTYEYCLENLVNFPNGNWSVQMEQDELIYQEVEYYSLEFDNETKHLTCKKKDNPQIDIYLLEMKKLSEH